MRNRSLSSASSSAPSSSPRSSEGTSSQTPVSDMMSEWDPELSSDSHHSPVRVLHGPNVGFPDYFKYSLTDSTKEYDDQPSAYKTYPNPGVSTVPEKPMKEHSPPLPSPPLVSPVVQGGSYSLPAPGYSMSLLTYGEPQSSFPTHAQPSYPSFSPRFRETNRLAGGFSAPSFTARQPASPRWPLTSRSTSTPSGFSQFSLPTFGQPLVNSHPLKVSSYLGSLTRDSEFYGEHLPCQISRVSTPFGSTVGASSFLPTTHSCLSSPHVNEGSYHIQLRGSHPYSTTYFPTHLSMASYGSIKSPMLFHSETRATVSGRQSTWSQPGHYADNLCMPSARGGFTGFTPRVYSRPMAKPSVKKREGRRS